MRRVTPNSPVPSEEQEQQAFIEWAVHIALNTSELSLLYAIPNAGKRHVNYAVKQKKLGLLAGIPDLCLPVARQGYHSLYLEMKRRRGGRLSEDQKLVIGALRHEGHRVDVCKGWDEAAAAVVRYLDLPIGDQGVRPKIPKHLRAWYTRALDLDVESDLEDKKHKETETH